jgi:thiamine monophosphate kinase
MIDISDGLVQINTSAAQSRRRRANGDSCRYRAPMAPCGQGGFRPALTGGEDYELLFLQRAGATKSWL